MWIFFGVIGLLIGAAASGFEGAQPGAIFGGLAGLGLKRLLRTDTFEIESHLLELDAAIQQLNQRLSALETNAAPAQTAANVLTTPAVEETFSPLGSSLNIHFSYALLHAAVLYRSTDLFA